ncbi:allophanate hydrolase [Mycobacterium sp. smrl_JER01]|uniref:allophanate hydrolase n=1 Tax=Mycobacterium sp. smrl_JER01 TaxID=3402633 RepID=UPI003AD35ECE
MTVWISRRPEADVRRELDTSRASCGSLAGVRLVVQDNVDVRGLPTTAGCPEFARVPERDAPVVAALRDAGAVVLGKANLDQFAVGLVGTRSPYGVVHDRRRPEFISGGPASGSAVAVAEGAADLAVVTDPVGTGGISAALQGIVSIKPTAGVIDGAGVLPGGRFGIGIFAGSLALADRAAAVIAAGAPARNWPADVRLAAPLSPVVAVPREPHPDRRWRSAFDAAVEALAGRGARIVEVDVAGFLAASRLVDDVALLNERLAIVDQFVESHPDAALDPAVLASVVAVRGVSAQQLIRERDKVRRLRDGAMSVLAGADVLVVPTVAGHPAIADVAAEPEAVDRLVGGFTNFCAAFDMCAVGVPAGTAGDAQFGVTVLARAFDDAVALDVAALLEGEPMPTVWPMAIADHVELVVFGAHLRGGPLVHQLTDRGARFAGEITTAARYKMVALPTTPPKPGVTRVPEGTEGAALTGHRWLLSPAALGAFLAALPAPMQLGAVEFADGSWRTAFGCDASVQGLDISGYGSWTNALAAGAVGQT